MLHVWDEEKQEFCLQVGLEENVNKISFSFRYRHQNADKIVIQT
jgi:hypothetical protein